MTRNLLPYYCPQQTCAGFPDNGQAEHDNERKALGLQAMVYSKLPTNVWTLEDTLGAIFCALISGWSIWAVLLILRDKP